MEEEAGAVGEAGDARLRAAEVVATAGASEDKGSLEGATLEEATLADSAAAMATAGMDTAGMAIGRGEPALAITTHRGLTRPVITGPSAILHGVPATIHLRLT